MDPANEKPSDSTPFQPVPQSSQPPVVNQPEVPLQPANAPQPFQPSTATNNPKKKISLPILIAIVIVLLMGVSAAAYFGVIVPNKPQNRLAAAFTDLAEQDHLTISGTFDYQTKDETNDFPGVAVDYSLRADVQKKIFQLSGQVGVGGAQFPYDLRYIDQDTYFKLGGLDGISDILGGADNSELGAALAQMLARLNDQWYVLDRSYLQEMGPEATCIADLSYRLTDEDVGKISDAYKRYPLFTVKNSSSEEINGTPTTKYELDPADEQTARDFADELNSLSIVKNMRECLPEDENATENEADEAAEQLSQGQIFAYITADRQFKRFEFRAEDDEAEVTMVMDFDFESIEVEKPSGAKPIQDLVSDLLGEEVVVPTDADQLQTLIQ